MALALNNLKRVDMPLNKQTKPNQTNQENLNIWICSERIPTGTGWYKQRVHLTSSVKLSQTINELNQQNKQKTKQQTNKKQTKKKNGENNNNDNKLAEKKEIILSFFLLFIFYLFFFFLQTFRQ